MIHVVIGMHKSGTTLVANILHASGINMIDTEAESLDYDEGGHFERAASNRINKDLLECGSAHSLDVIKPLRLGAWPGAMQLRAERLVTDLGREHVDWGFKDPRTCLTYGFWRDILGPHSIVFIYRQPRELVSHYVARMSGSRLATATRALHAWYVYNEQALGWLRSSGQPWLKLDYSALMQGDHAFHALSEFVGRSLKDTRSRAQYRSRAGRSLTYWRAKSRLKRRHGLDVDDLACALEELPDSGANQC